MTPKAKIRLLIFSLLIPYFIFVLYFVLRLPAEPLPSWFGYVAGGYFLGTILLVTIVGQKLGQGQPPSVTEKSLQASQYARSRATGLVLVWTGFLIYGAYRTLIGDFPLQRAIPAGIILLAFIGLFSWLLYRDKSSQSR